MIQKATQHPKLVQDWQSGDLGAHASRGLPPVPEETLGSVMQPTHCDPLGLSLLASPHPSSYPGTRPEVPAKWQDLERSVRYENVKKPSFSVITQPQGQGKCQRLSEGRWLGPGTEPDPPFFGEQKQLMDPRASEACFPCQLP